MMSLKGKNEVYVINVFILQDLKASLEFCRQHPSEAVERWNVQKLKLPSGFTYWQNLKQNKI